MPLKIGNVGMPAQTHAPYVPNPVTIPVNMDDIPTIPTWPVQLTNFNRNNPRGTNLNPNIRVIQPGPVQLTNLNPNIRVIQPGPVQVTNFNRNIPVIQPGPVQVTNFNRNNPVQGANLNTNIRAPGTLTTNRNQKGNVMNYSDMIKANCWSGD
jgi:hypothetical protein